MSANTDWVNKYQNPFDQKMASMPDGPEKTALMQQYVNDMNDYGAKGGDAAKTIAGARSSFDKYYGDAYKASQAAPATAGASTPAETPAGTDWTTISNAYGLGAPPAVGMPSTLNRIHIGDAPQAQASLMDLNAIPQPVATQQTVSPEVLAMKSGQGYSPAILAQMKANAIDTASQAGVAQMGQMKRILGQSGVRGGANAAVQGDIARQALQNQGTALGNIDINNAQVGNENAKFGIGQENQIGQSNMASANSMALANANNMFSGLQQNQTAQNQTNQMNTGLNFQRQENQSNMDFNTQKSQWDELNKRYGQSQNILGSWGAAA
jgi:hypothetical protein